MPTTRLPSLILFSGLSADHQVLALQKLAWPQLVVPKWLVPEPNESLSDYCRRFAMQLDPQQPVVLGGVSFGGIVALEMARHVRPECVVLIGSVRTPDELPWRIRMFRPFRHLVHWIPIRLLQWLAVWAAKGTVRIQTVGEVARQFRDADPRVMRWSLWAILSWRKPPEVPSPVYQIHGARDFVFPVSLTHPDRVVPTGGHLICITHAEEVNEFLGECLADVKIAERRSNTSY